MPAGRPAVREDGVVAEMRVAVDDAEAAERKPPGREHGGGDGVARLDRVGLVREHAGALAPVERQQPAGRQFRPDVGHAHRRLVLQHVLVERDVLGLARVIELLAQPRGDLDADLGGVDRRIEALAQRQQQLKLVEVGFDRRLHVRILQLAGERRAVARKRAVHLAERGGGGRVMLERAELRLPVGAELGAHAALDEGPAHWRRLALQLHQLGSVFRRHRVGNGGEQLRHLHDRPFEAAERGGKRDGVALAAALRADQPLAGDARGDAADARADRGIAAGAGGEAVAFGVVGGGHGAHLIAAPGKYKVPGFSPSASCP